MYKEIPMVWQKLSHFWINDDEEEELEPVED